MGTYSKVRLFCEEKPTLKENKTKQINKIENAQINHLVFLVCCADKKKTLLLVCFFSPFSFFVSD